MGFIILGVIFFLLVPICWYCTKKNEIKFIKTQKPWYDMNIEHEKIVNEMKTHNINNSNKYIMSGKMYV